MIAQHTGIQGVKAEMSKNKATKYHELLFRNEQIVKILNIMDIYIYISIYGIIACTVWLYPLCNMLTFPYLIILNKTIVIYRHHTHTTEYYYTTLLAGM